MLKNNRFRLAIAASILILATIGNLYAQKREVPKGWKEIKICGVSFIAPKQLKDKKARGIDSCVGIFKSKNIRLGIDFGAYTATPEDSTGYRDSKTETLEIDGNKATLTIYGYQSYVYIVTSEWESGRTAFGMLISGKTAKDSEIARQIFQSVRFINEQ